MKSNPAPPNIDNQELKKWLQFLRDDLLEANTKIVKLTAKIIDLEAKLKG